MDIKEFVIEQLKDYTRNEKKIALLQFELDHPVNISDDAMILSMSMSTPNLDGNIHGGVPADKTTGVALNYHEAAQHIRNENRKEIEQQLDTLKAGKERVDFYLGLIDPKYAQVLRLHYIENLTWPEISKRAELSSRSITRFRDEGIKQLVEFYTCVYGGGM